MDLRTVEKWTDDQLLAACAYYESAPSNITNRMVYACLVDEIEERTTIIPKGLRGKA